MTRSTRIDLALTGGLWAIALAAFLLFLGCGGGGRKSLSPAPVPSIPVSTPWGSLSVEWACPGVTMDRAAIEQDVARAYLKGEQQDPQVAGLRLDGAWALFGAETNPDWNGHHEWAAPMGSRIHLRCPPSPSALAHELQHRFGHQLGLQCNSRPGHGLDLIDHPGGFDLACRRLQE